MRNTNRKICTIFSKNLQYYMDLNGIDRQTLADALDFKYSTVCNWLSCYSYASEDKIEQLADYFGISKYQLTENNNVQLTINSSSSRRKELMEASTKLNDEQIDFLISITKIAPELSDEDLKILLPLVKSFGKNK